MRGQWVERISAHTRRVQRAGAIAWNIVILVRIMVTPSPAHKGLICPISSTVSPAPSSYSGSELSGSSLILSGASFLFSASEERFTHLTSLDRRYIYGGIGMAVAATALVNSIALSNVCTPA